MGNTESTYDDDSPLPYRGSSMDHNYQPWSYAGSSMDHNYQPRSYAGSSMDHSHQPTLYAGDSVHHNYQHPQEATRIADNFNTLEEVISALREAGLESSNLILGIDFTKSNEWTGKYSYNRKSLHAISNTPNPYEQAISIIGRTLSPFDEDNLIPCFGFGDASTHDRNVFSFYPDKRSCRGFEEVLARYREILPHLKLAVAVEQAFSAGRSILDETRSSMSLESLEAQACLDDWFKANRRI